MAGIHALRGMRVAGTAVETLVNRRDLDALAWVGEQYAVHTDQLGAFLNCTPSRTAGCAPRGHNHPLAASPGDALISGCSQIRQVVLRLPRVRGRRERTTPHMTHLGPLLAQAGAHRGRKDGRR